MNMKKVMIISAMAGVMCGAMTGCIGIGMDSYAEMVSDVEPTYTPPTPFGAGEPRGKEAVVGEWEGILYVNSKLVIPRIRYVQNSRTANVSKQSYKFFDDGKYIFTTKTQDGKETSSNGDWTYADGFLTISEKKDDANSPSMRMKVLWYQDKFIELRMEDLASYEELLKKGGVENVKGWYEQDGSLRTHMDIVNQGSRATMKMIQSPLRFNRIGDVE